MPNCPYCNSPVRPGAQFCKGHNIAYKRRLLNQYRISHSPEILEELRFFGWTPFETPQITPVSYNFRKFGIEFELDANSDKAVKATVNLAQKRGIRIHESSYTHEDGDSWKIVTDGSLRGSYTREFVSPPISSEEGIKEVEDICSILSFVGASVNNTCSAHIHLDASDLSARDMARVIKFYAEYERQIDALHQPSRRRSENQYCKSLGHGIVDPERVTSVEQIRNLYSSRYYKVNIQAYARHGTLEFRQHGGTTNFMKIYYWIMLCTRIIEFAKTSNPINSSIPLFEALNLSEEEKIFWEFRKSQLSGGVSA